MLSKVIFNGISSEDLGIVIQSPPSYEVPEKDYDTTHISGKNGDIVINNKSYKNSKRTYYFAAIFKPGSNFAQTSHAISEWLHSANGYARLEDSYEPEIYRMAMFNQEFELPNIYDKATTIEAEFICKPQRYLKIGELPIEIIKDYETSSSDSLVVVNPTKQDAKPLIKFNIEAYAPLHFTMEIADETENIIQKITYNAINQELRENNGNIDCEIEECYDNNYESINTDIELSNFEFPVLKPGKNIITIKTNIDTKVTVNIIPRWWML